MESTSEEEVLRLVAARTRAHQFNFQKTTEEVNSMLGRHYSVAEVRQIFAASMSIQPNVSTESENGKEHADKRGRNAPESRASSDSINGRPTDSNSSERDENTNEESLTFSDVFKRAKQQQLENEKLREATFQRVLSSLQIHDSIQLIDSLNSEHREVLQAVSRYEEQRSLEKYEEECIQAEKEENARLKAEREALRQRFNPESVDSVGIDPLNDQIRLNTNGDSAEKVHTSGADISKTTKQHHPESGIDNRFANFHLDELLNTPEFDSLLTQIEQEIEQQAQGKNEADVSEEPSELGEVLSYLNEVSSNRPKESTRTASSFQSSVTYAHVEAISSSQTQSAASSSSFNNSPQAPQIPLPEPPLSTSHENAQPVKSDLPTNKSTGVRKKHQVDRGRGGSYGGRGLGKSAREGASSHDYRSDGSDSSSDNEDDWKSMRQKLKSEEKSVAATTKPPVHCWQGKSSSHHTALESSSLASHKTNEDNFTGDESPSEEEDHDEGGDDKDLDDETPQSTLPGSVHIAEDRPPSPLKQSFSPPTVPLPSDSEPDEKLSSESRASDDSSGNIVQPLSSSVVEEETPQPSSLGFGGILRGDGNRDRGRKSLKSRSATSQVEAARKRREQRVLKVTSTESQKTESLENNQTQEGPRSQAVEADGRGDDLKREGKVQSRDDPPPPPFLSLSPPPPSSSVEINNEPSPSALKSSLQPQDVFPDPSTPVHFPALPPGIAEVFAHAFPDSDNKSPTNEAVSLSENLVTLRCRPNCPPQENVSDVWVYSLLAWLVAIQEEIESKIIGVYLTSCPDDHEDKQASCLYVVLEGVSPTPSSFLAKRIMQTAKDVPAPFSPSNATCSVHDLILVVSPHEAVTTLHSLVTLPFRAPREAGSLVSGDDWVHRINRCSVTSCVFKNYFFTSSREDNHCDQLVNAFSTCERSGLRLCGLRTAYILPDKMDKTDKTSVLKFIQSSVLKPQKGSSFASGDHYVLVACFYSPRYVACEKLRVLLGPEDALLAKRTDPKSIRALFSSFESNLSPPTKNVAYSLPSQISNCWRETQFWFGPRFVECSSSKSPESCLASLILPSERYFVLGLSFECLEEGDTLRTEEFIDQKSDKLAGELSTLQREAIRSILEATNDSMKFVSYWSVSQQEFGKYGFVSHDNEHPDELAFSLVFLFKSSTSDVFAETVRGSISAMCESLSSSAAYWQVHASLKVRAKFKRHTGANSPKVQVMRNETIKPLDGNDGIRFNAEDFNSHEDVGLQDVAVVTVPILHTGRDMVALDMDREFSSLIPPQDISLRLLEALPPGSCATIIGVFSTIESSTDEDPLVHEKDKMFICLRAFHLLENINDAIHLCLDRMAAAANEGSGLVNTKSINSKSRLLRLPTSAEFKVLKGRRALELIRSCYPQALSASHPLERELLTYPATCDLKSFVPLGNEAPRTREQSVERALFPPGSFLALSVVVMSYPRAGGEKSLRGEHGAFLRAIKRLEKAGFDIVSLSTRRVDRSLARLGEKLVGLGQAGFASGCQVEREAVQEWFDQLVGHAVLVLVVSGNSALRSLAPVVGPFDPQQAQEKYPTSISASFLASSLRVLHSPTTPSTASMLRHFAESGVALEELLEGVGQASARLVLSSFGSSSAASSSSTEESEEPTTLQKRRLEADWGREEAGVCSKLRDVSLVEHNQWSMRSERGATIVSSSGDEVTCIVLTSALLHRVGLSSFLQVLYKEGLQVVQARSRLLHPVAARKLLDLAGQSSLSMKPSLSTLLSGPVLFLALEGSAHVILRIKTILQQPCSASCGVPLSYMHVYNANRGDDSQSDSLGQLDEHEWGLLASSSSRLARDLLLYCFDETTSQLVSSSLSIRSNAVEDHSTGTTEAPSSPSFEDAFHTPTGSPMGASFGLKTPFGASPRYYTPPTSHKANAKDELDGGSSQLEELD